MKVISKLQREAASMKVTKEGTFFSPTHADILTITFGNVQSMHSVFFPSIHQTVTEQVAIVHMNEI